MVFLLVSFLSGLLVGMLLQRLVRSRANETAMLAENESLRVELETLRSQVDGHFATSAGMFQNLTEEYRKLLEHMAQGARSLDVELPSGILADFSVVPPSNQLPEQTVDPDNQTVGKATLAEQPDRPSAVTADTDPGSDNASAADDQQSPEQVATRTEAGADLDPTEATKTTG